MTTSRLTDLTIRTIYARIEPPLKVGPTEIRTRAAGFKVQSANHYTMGPLVAAIIVLFELKTFVFNY